MAQRLKRRLPLLLMTFLLTVWVSYAYLDFIQVELEALDVVLWGLLVVLLAEIITTNRWTSIITGGVGLTHVLCSLIPVPGLHELAMAVNECALDTYEKVFWTDRHFFVSEAGSTFLVFFIVCISIHTLYTKLKSIGLTTWVLMLYIFFMEFFNVAEPWLVVVCLLHLVLALLVLYGYQWHHKAENKRKKKISLKYGVPLLCGILAVTMVFTLMVNPEPNEDFQDWLNEGLENMWAPPDNIQIAPRFSQSVFNKNGRIGGDVSFQNEYLFSVAVTTPNGEALSDDSVYLRGIACDYFEDDIWQTAIDTGSDKLLEDYFAENPYFCADGVNSFVQNALVGNTGLYQSRTFTVVYDETKSDTLFNHTYTTNILAYGTTYEDVYYDYSTYTYHQGMVEWYSVSYLGLNRNSDALQTFLLKNPNATFAAYDRLDATTRKQLKNYYLQMPADMTEAVTAMAQRLTDEYSNDYEKAEAIESYLKNNYTYTLTPGNVPGDRNLVEYFLFDSKEGYCVYYASAMVMLCRSIGIPARYVRGYRVDDVTNGVLLEVTDANAHAWVEVFIPQLGWVTFDPVGAASFAQNNPSFVAVPNTPSPTPSTTPTTPPIPTVTVTPTPSGQTTTTEGETPSATPTATLTVPPTATPTIETETPIPSPTENVTDVPEKENGAVVWWLLGIGGPLLLVGFFLWLFMRRKKQAPGVSEQEILQSAPVQFYHRIVRVKTFMGMPLEMGETVSQYLKRLQNPELEAMAAILEACFYHQAVLTKEQYKSLQAILQQEEGSAIKQKGKLKWMWFCLRYKS